MARPATCSASESIVTDRDPLPPPPPSPTALHPDPPPATSVTRRGPHAGHARLVALGEVLLCSSVPTQFAIGALLDAIGLETPVPGRPLPVPFVLALGVTDTAVLIGLMVVLTRAHGESLRTLWLGHRPAGREALLGVALVPAIFMIVVVLLNLLHLLAPWLRTVPENPLEQLATTGRAQALALVFVAIVAGGVREELQRAFILVRFERHLGGARVGILVVSTAFGLLHALQGADAVIVTGVLGACWAVLYFRRRSVVAPLVSHAGFNAIQILRVAFVGA